MHPMSQRAGFLVDNADVPALRAAISKLAALGYSESGISNRLGLQDLADLQWRLVSVYRSERLAGREQLALAIDLLLLQGALPPDERGRLFVDSEAQVLIRAGLLAIDETGVARARASLFPFGDNLIFSDHAWPHLPHPGYVTVPSDQVMWIGLDSRHLAYCTTRRPFRTALDLCTGSGIHALLASAHAERVLAIDINPRAACCTRFNAAVSGAGNLEVVVADLFEGARGERFDLITANPPFVPSPLDNLGFRDGGRTGEVILKRIVAGLPQHLAPGGIAQIITELGDRDDEPLVLRLRQWLDGAAMDIHILRLGEHEAMKYATRHAKGDTFEAFLASVHEWASNLLTQGYRRVVSLVISFQWSDPASGPPWDLTEQSPPPRRAAGPEIDAVFQAQGLSRQIDWVTLKNNRLSRSGSIALLDARVLGGNIRARAKATLLGRSLTIEHHLDPVEREILDRMDGPIRISELIGICRDPDADEPIIEASVRSLLRRRLVVIDEGIGRLRD
jgi:methylase of polypeptide subunit release factors